MAKLRAGLLALLLASPVAALSAGNSIDLRFDHIAVNEFARVVFAEGLGESYVFDDAFTVLDKTVTLDLRAASPSTLRNVLSGVIRQNGFELSQVGGVNHVDKRVKVDPAPELEMLVYLPKFRTVAYLQGVIRSFVPLGRFAGSVMGSAVSAGQAVPAQGA